MQLHYMMKENHNTHNECISTLNQLLITCQMEVDSRFKSSLLEH